MSGKIRVMVVDDSAIARGFSDSSSGAKHSGRAVSPEPRYPSKHLPQIRRK